MTEISIILKIWIYHPPKLKHFVYYSWSFFFFVFLLTFLISWPLKPLVFFPLMDPMCVFTFFSTEIESAGPPPQVLLHQHAWLPPAPVPLSCQLNSQFRIDLIAFHSVKHTVQKSMPPFRLCVSLHVVGVPQLTWASSTAKNLFSTLPGYFIVLVP